MAEKSIGTGPHKNFLQVTEKSIVPDPYKKILQVASVWFVGENIFLGV